MSTINVFRGLIITSLASLVCSCASAPPQTPYSTSPASEINVQATISSGISGTQTAMAPRNTPLPEATEPKQTVPVPSPAQDTVSSGVELTLGNSGGFRIIPGQAVIEAPDSGGAGWKNVAVHLYFQALDNLSASTLNPSASFGSTLLANIGDSKGNQYLLRPVSSTNAAGYNYAIISVPLGLTVPGMWMLTTVPNDAVGLELLLSSTSSGFAPPLPLPAWDGQLPLIDSTTTLAKVGDTVVIQERFSQVDVAKVTLLSAIYSSNEQEWQIAASIENLSGYDIKFNSAMPRPFQIITPAIVYDAVLQASDLETIPPAYVKNYELVIPAPGREEPAVFVAMEKAIFSLEP